MNFTSLSDKRDVPVYVILTPKHSISTSLFRIKRNLTGDFNLKKRDVDASCVID